MEVLAGEDNMVAQVVRRLHWGQVYGHTYAHTEQFRKRVGVDSSLISPKSTGILGCTRSTTDWYKPSNAENTSVSCGNCYITRGD